MGLLLLCSGRGVYRLNVGFLAWVTVALVDEGGGLVARKGSRICQRCTEEGITYDGQLLVVVSIVGGVARCRRLPACTSQGLWQMVAMPPFEASVMRKGMTLLVGEAGRRKVAVVVEGIDSFLPDGSSDVDLHPS
ncbi:hypothetical protein SLEP1_g29816 [Rubroshorea leprosula]|uniref:Uncharacterized protein n=1 Tax=Rubroshorea leprosula TaxID=152421 RepID=A0AAV5K6C6_9ROSI|nr:hypothetical protein SLEP1_g29816 [Rubroshorea leprosula]